MAPVFCLLVVVRVAVNVVEDNNVGRGQINAQATSFGGQKEYKYTHICIELIYQMYPAEHKTPCIRPRKTLHTGSRAEYRSWDDLLQERTVALHSSSKVQMLYSRERVPTDLCSDQRNTKSGRWIAKTENRLKKRFLMIIEHKESVRRQWKTETHEPNGRVGDELRFMTIFCTNCTCKGRNRYHLITRSNTTARMAFFLNKGKSIQKKKKSSKILEAENQLSSNTRKAWQRFQLQGQTEWFVLEKPRGISIYCKRDTLQRNSYRCYYMLTQKSNTPGTAEDTHFSFPWLRL